MIFASKRRLLLSCIVFFLLCAAKGFVVRFRPTSSSPATKYVPGAPQRIYEDTAGIEHRYPLDGQPRRIRDNESLLRAFKPATGGTAYGIDGTAVREMASFLCIKLMQKVMVEAKKGDGEGEVNLDLEAMERLTKALQMSSGQKEAVVPETRSIAKTTGDDDTEGLVEADETNDETTPIEAKVTPEPETSPSVPSASDDSVADTVADTTINSRVHDDDQCGTDEETKETFVDESPSSVSPLEIGAKEREAIPFRPLEIVASNVLPLRPSSIPQKKQQTVLKEETASKEKATSPRPIGRKVGKQDILASEEADNTLSQKPNEFFQRRLLQTRLELDAQASSAKLEFEKLKSEELFRRRLLKTQLGFAARPNQTEKASDSPQVVLSETKASPPSTSDDEKKADELFRRRLLKKKFRYDARDVELEEISKPKPVARERSDNASKTVGVSSEKDSTIEQELFQRKLLRAAIEYDALSRKEARRPENPPQSSTLLDSAGVPDEEIEESGPDPVILLEDSALEEEASDAASVPSRVPDSVTIASLVEETTSQRDKDGDKDAVKCSPLHWVSSLPTMARKRYDKEAQVSQSFVQREFRPAWWSANKHFQTIVGTLFRKETMYSRGKNDVGVMLDILGIKNGIAPDDRSSIKPLAEFEWDRRHRMETNDEDFFVVDWKYANNDYRKNSNECDNTSSRDNPVCLICHGLESCSDSEIAQELAIACNEVNIDAACLNFRGCSDSGEECNLTTRAYHLGFTDDLRQQIEEIHSQNPSRRIYLSGFSLGAGVVTKLLAELGPDAYKYNVCGAAVNAVPFDSGQCQQNLNESGFTKTVYGDRLLDSMKTRLKKQYDTCGFAFDRSEIDACQNIMDMENLCIAPAFGFDDAYDYYEKVKTADKLHRVCVPELIVQAKDDPFFVGLETLSNDENRPVRIQYTAKGGHCGYIFHQQSASGEEESKTSWMPTQLARFIQHIEETRASEAASACRNTTVLAEELVAA